MNYPHLWPVLHKSIVHYRQMVRATTGDEYNPVNLMAMGSLYAQGYTTSQVQEIMNGHYGVPLNTTELRKTREYVLKMMQIALTDTQIEQMYTQLAGMGVDFSPEGIDQIDISLIRRAAALGNEAERYSERKPLNPHLFQVLGLLGEGADFSDIFAMAGVPLSQRTREKLRGYYRLWLYGKDSPQFFTNVVNTIQDSQLAKGLIWDENGEVSQLSDETVMKFIRYVFFTSGREFAKDAKRKKHIDREKNFNIPHIPRYINEIRAMIRYGVVLSFTPEQLSHIANMSVEEAVKGKLDYDKVLELVEAYYRRTGRIPSGIPILLYHGSGLLNPGQQTQFNTWVSALTGSKNEGISMADIFGKDVNNKISLGRSFMRAMGFNSESLVERNVVKPRYFFRDLGQEHDDILYAIQQNLLEYS